MSSKKVDIRTDQIIKELEQTAERMKQGDRLRVKAEMQHFFEVYLPVHVELLIESIDEAKAVQFRGLLDRIHDLEHESFMRYIRGEEVPSPSSS